MNMYVIVVESDSNYSNNSFTLSVHFNYYFYSSEPKYSYEKRYFKPFLLLNENNSSLYF